MRRCIPIFTFLMPKVMMMPAAHSLGKLYLMILLCTTYRSVACLHMHIHTYRMRLAILLQFDELLLLLRIKKSNTEPFQTKLLVLSSCQKSLVF